MLRGGILHPISITVIMAAGVDRLLLALPAGTGVIRIAIDRAACGLLALQNPSMRAAGGASPTVLRAIAVVLINISS